MTKRTMPDVDPAAAAAGLAVSILVAVTGVLLGYPAISAISGVTAGGYLAGRIARRDGLFHGAVVGIVAIILTSVLSSAGNENVSNILVDTVTIVVSDVLLLLSASAGGWLSTRS
jgi:hypothetical protein